MSTTARPHRVPPASWLLLVVLLTSALPAQESEPQAPEPLLAIDRRAGLQMCDDELWGVGAGYKVRFDEHGFELTPTLGPAAPRNFPVSFRLESIRRGDTHSPLDGAAPKWSELRVEYDRGVAIERYDVGVEAMEQSFLFASRPAGKGDLVVRGRLDTDLLVTTTTSGLRLQLPGVGRLEIGGVTGVDARGERVAGGLRLVDGMLELSLPADFVDRAALPFVLDPLFGNVLNISGNATHDRVPDAAFDQATGNYLVVWSTAVSQTDADVYGQRVSRSGVLVGNRVVISVTTGTIDLDPRVCNLQGPGAFVVVYARSTDVHGRWILAGTATVSPATTIAGSPDLETSPDVGGDLATSGARAVCVWVNRTTDSLQSAAMVPDFVSRPTLTAVARNSFAGGFQAASSRIAKGGGTPRRFAVAWQAVNTTRDTWCLVVDQNGAPISSPTALDTRTSNALGPSVDGDGTQWVVAWQVSTGLIPVPLEIAASSIALSTSGQLAAAPLRVVGTGAQVSFPAVMATAGSTLVAWSDDPLANAIRNLLVTSIDPFGCAPCEGRSTVGGLQASNFAVAGCAAGSAGGPGDEALLVWQSTANSNGDVNGRFWRSADGIVNSLGGGCGNGGLARAPCVRVPNPDFRHHLRNSTSNAPAVLVQSLGQGAATCGSCTLVPSLTGAIALFVLTDGNGHASVASPIPNNLALRGLVQFEQWLTLRPGAACSQSGIDLSGALRLQIE